MPIPKKRRHPKGGYMECPCCERMYDNPYKVLKIFNRERGFCKKGYEEHRNHRNSLYKEYKENNPEKVNEYQSRNFKKFQKKNPKYMKEYKKQWKIENPDYDKKYREENRDFLIKQSREYYHLHKEEINRKRREKRAKKKNSN